MAKCIEIFSIDLLPKKIYYCLNCNYDSLHTDKINFFEGWLALWVSIIMYLKFLLFILDAHSCAQALRHALRNPVLLTDARLASRTRSIDNDNDTIDPMQYLKRAVSIIIHVHTACI